MEFCTGKHMFKDDISKDIEALMNNSDCSSKLIVDSLKNVSKKVYDHLYKDNSITELKAKSFRKLLIDGFDAEQIFQQIELQNKSALEHFSKSTSTIDDSKFIRSFIRSEAPTAPNIIHVEEDAGSDFSDRIEEYDFDDDSDSSVPDNRLKKLSPELKSNNDADILSDNEVSLIDNSEELDSSADEKIILDDPNSSVKVPKSKKVRFQNKVHFKSIVDDQFFKLSNLDEFLKVEDLKAENNLDELSEDEDEINYFEDIPSDEFEDSDDEMNDKAMEKKPSKDIMYEDFFDAPESGDESIDKQIGESNDTSNKKTFEDEDYGTELNHADETEAGNEAPIPENSTDKISKTPFELEQEKINRTIANYEEKLVQKSEWHLTGEVAASSRPKDSLLHQETDFDVNAKPVLIEDSNLCEKTENAIKNIIKNKAYNDGQRKFKPKIDVTAYKKEVVLDQSKSKKSLAAVYEEDYLKKKYGEQEQEDPKHAEIKKLMDSLLPELQTLFCHIPKPAIPDIKIVSNLPAITVEEVAPTSISDATLLAPEEVKKKSGLIKGHSERTDTDRKRERRKKKIFQRNKFKKTETEVADGKPLSAKARKQDKIDTLKKLKQNRYTKIADMGAEKIKSSKDFFSRLQDSVSSKVQQPQSKKRKR